MKQCFSPPPPIYFWKRWKCSEILDLYSCDQHMDPARALSNGHSTSAPSSQNVLDQLMSNGLPEEGGRTGKPRTLPQSGHHWKGWGRQERTAMNLRTCSSCPSFITENQKRNIRRPPEKRTPTCDTFLFHASRSLLYLKYSPPPFSLKKVPRWLAMLKDNVER